MLNIGLLFLSGTYKTDETGERTRVVSDNFISACNWKNYIINTVAVLIYLLKDNEKCSYVMVLMF